MSLTKSKDENISQTSEQGLSTNEFDMPSEGRNLATENKAERQEKNGNDFFSVIEGDFLDNAQSLMSSVGKSLLGGDEYVVATELTDDDDEGIATGADDDDDDDELIETEPKVSVAEIFAPYMQIKARQIAKLNKYRNYLVKKNKRQNLTAITDEYGIVVKHFLDSALGAKFIPQNAHLCDVGSGAGFPAVVLKIMRKDLHITMVDSVGKKVEFLRRLCKKLDIEAERFCARAETLSLTRRESFDCVTARAVAALPTLLEYCMPLVAVGGIFLAYKGADADQEAADAQKAAKTLGAKLEEKHHFVLPNGDKRCILVYKKILETPRRFPRGQNLPKKKPIQ